MRFQPVKCNMIQLTKKHNKIQASYTAAFTYYYDPAILRNKLTHLLIFRDLALRKRDSKKLIVYFYEFNRVCTNIPKLYGFVVYFLWISGG